MSKTSSKQKTREEPEDKPFNDLDFHNGNKLALSDFTFQRPDYRIFGRNTGLAERVPEFRYAFR